MYGQAESLQSSTMALLALQILETPQLALHRRRQQHMTAQMYIDRCTLFQSHLVPCECHGENDHG